MWWKICAYCSDCWNDFSVFLLAVKILPIPFGQQLYSSEIRYIKKVFLHYGEAIRQQWHVSSRTQLFNSHRTNNGKKCYLLKKTKGMRTINSIHTWINLKIFVFFQFYFSTNLRQFAAGSLAGITSQSCTYPLDLARARMAVTDKYTGYK